MADGQHNRVFIHDGIVVAEFGSDDQLARDTGDALDELLADHAGIGGGAAGGDIDFLDFAGQFGGQVEFVQANIPVLEIHTPGQGVRQRAHLFVDFLLHEVAVLAFFSGGCVPGDGVDRGRYRRAVQRLHTDLGTGYHCHLARLEEDDLAGMFEDGRDVGSDEVFALAQTEHHPPGVPDAGADDFIGFVGRQQDDAVSPLDLLEGAPGGFGQAKTGG